MNPTGSAALTTATKTTMLPAADPDRRFHAFVLDRLATWTVVGATAWASYHFLISRGGVGAGFLVILCVLLMVGAGLAVAQGVAGTSPGKAALGLRVVHVGVLVVMDRGSTNGSVLIRQGVARDLLAGKPATLLPGDEVAFGDRRMTVAREPG